MNKFRISEESEESSSSSSYDSSHVSDQEINVEVQANLVAEVSGVLAEAIVEVAEANKIVNEELE